MKQRFFLRSDDIKRNAARFVWELPADQDHPLVVDIKPMTRSIEQNSKFHAICSDVAKQATYAGRKLSPEQWKVLFVSGHAIATKQGADMMPGLEGEFVNLRESTSGMGVARMASLIEYVMAYCAENGIKLYDLERSGLVKPAVIEQGVEIDGECERIAA